MTGYTFEEHTGELEVRLEAPTLAGLFLEAGRALAEVMGATPDAPGSGEQERVRLSAPDPETLLVDWVNELILRAERAKRVMTELRVERATERELEARVRGSEVEALRTQVKAATFHDLRVERGPEGYRATLVLDV